MAKILLLMRHAKSSWDDEDLSDHERPLNKRGRSDAPRMARHLAVLQLIPNEVACSTATRARQTLELMLEEWPTTVAARFESGLYLTSPDHYWRRAGEFDDERNVAMIIAHNPGLESVVRSLDSNCDHFPTAAVAVIRSNSPSWSEFANSDASQLTVEVHRPKDLD